MSQSRALLLASTLVAVAMLSACGGESTTPGPGSPVSVIIAPDTTSADQGATIQFTASVSGTNDPAVTWSIREGSAGGSITQAGLYTAPARAMNAHVVATSVSAPGKSAGALVSVNAVSVSMPSTAGVPRGHQRQFIAEVTGTIHKDVTWTVDEGAAGGVITSDGVYTAPMGGGPFHVTARSVGDPSKAARAAVVITDAGFRMLAVSMLVPRISHTATLLPDGKVLVAGGDRCDDAGCSGRLLSAELFDPATETFSFTGSMAFVRTGHTATLLNNGTVLIAGGGDPDTGDADTAEIYDPDTGSFVRVGDMTEGRSLHTASLLTDGRVLIAGGSPTPDGSYPVKTSELYDPSSATFSAAGNMPSEAASHTASILLDGTVLTVGGWGVACPGTETAVATFDPASNHFSPGVNLSQGRAGHTATTLNDGRVLITGGDYMDVCNFQGFTFDTGFIFDPATSTYSPDLLMREKRTGHSATLLANGQVLVVGSLAELFDTAASTFVITGDPSVPHANRRATRLSDGRVLFTGSTSVAEIYE